VLLKTPNTGHSFTALLDIYAPWLKQSLHTCEKKVLSVSMFPFNSMPKTNAQ